MIETEIPPEESEESQTDDQDDQDDDADEIAVAPAGALAATSLLTPAPAPAPPPTTEALARQRILQWAAANKWPAYAGAGVKIEQGMRDWQIYTSFFSCKQILALAAALLEGEESQETCSQHQ